jgi:metal-sulfur cluster biosynthetic enzyme
MAVTKKQIMEKLSGVVDPELGVSIVDLGLVYEVHVKKTPKKGKQKADIVMTLTTPACPLADYLLGQVEAKLNELPDIDINVRVVFQPVWSPDKMSEKAKIVLGMK